MRVTNDIPLECSLLLPVHTVNCVQTLKVLAEGGDPTALWNLGDMHYNGTGGFYENEDAAVEYYRKAALAGHPDGPDIVKARCAFSDTNLHSRMLSDRTYVRLKLFHACDQWHSSLAATPLLPLPP